MLEKGGNKMEREKVGQRKKKEKKERKMRELIGLVFS